MGRIDIVVDIETLGKSVDNPIIQIGAIAFDITTRQLLSSFEGKASVSTFANIDGTTLEWWLTTAPEVLRSIVLSPDKTDERTLLANFSEYLKLYIKPGTDVYLWGNGLLFDNMILSSRMSLYGITYPISYRNERDQRTLVDLYCAKHNISEKSLREQFPSAIAHNGLEDAYAQAALIGHCYAELIK